MDNPAFESRNRHSSGLAPALAAPAAAGAQETTGRTAKPVPILTQSAVKCAEPAEQDDALMRRPTHHAADRSFLRIGAAGLVATFVAAIVAPSAHAQSIPLPRPAPQARSNGSFQMSASEPQAVRPPVAIAPKTSATTSTPPNPIIPDPRRNVPASIFMSFDANQKAQASKVSSYLSSLSNLSGNFVQVGPDGSRTTGDFFIQKPGKVRFEYDAPTTIAMVSDGQSLAVRDSKLATQDIYPLSQTPLRYLLSDRIDLMKDTNVVAVSADDLYTSVTIEEKNALVGTSRLMLMVGTKDGQLKQWTVTDPQGYDTTVAIYNLDTAKKPDPGLFKIDFTKYPTSGAN
ncbi:outer-membrane lipoprotein carrier protein LolA [Tardiphaga sp. 37S4]|jgi:outer membrane lipoprotein-sorting protein|nr:outer-membrane lipoprotein carrier protein LolA [Tardiphaga sp. 37S4]UFS75261.1 outer-membrane lipoprotein carrier protein LolA [Tardiphaga sp. 37S4]